MNAEALIPIVLSSIMAIVAIITLARNGKKETQDDAVQRASLAADVKYIRTSIDDIKVENKVMSKDVGDLKIKVAEIDQSVKHAHQRLDDLRKDHEHD